MPTPTRRHFCLATGLAAGARGNAAAGVWVEAASFEQPGGWVVDHQSIDRTGSAYLLAHGCGRPVADAVTTVRFPAGGEYFAFVRTRDWVGPWKSERTPPELRASGSPGAFQLLIDGRPLAATFGIEGPDWHWAPGGAVRIQSTEVALALRDLTGFDGRCAGILFSRTAQPKLPDSAAEVREWRTRLAGGAAKPSPAGKFDLVVVGGGVAGVCAAVTAARRGLRVALLHNRPVLGGNSSSEIRVSPACVRSVEPYVGLGSVLAEFDWNRTVEPVQSRQFQQGDDARLKLVRAEPRLSLFLDHHVFQVEKDGSTLKAVHAQDVRSGASIRLEGSLFADCSGDANLGFLAGAEWRMGREGRASTAEPRAPESGDAMVLGSTLHWYSRNTNAPSAFPELRWALSFAEEKCQYATEGAWNWETGFHLDQATQTELVRDHMLRAIYGNWAYQKNRSRRKEFYADMELAWVAYVLGKRESRRLIGDIVYSEHDLVSGKLHPDALIACNWGIDIHLAEPRNQRQFAGWAFRSIAEHEDKGRAPMRWLPYRSLYSRNIGNLFMAGRNVSCTHVAFAWFRTQRTTGMMGEVVGLAASLCAEHRCSPRGVYANRLSDLQALAKKGAGRG